MVERLFYYTGAWAEDQLKLPAPAPRRQIEWWDEDGEAPNREPSVKVDIDPTHGNTAQEQLDGFVETFVIGWPRSKLVRRQGFGSEPRGSRMWPPRLPVVDANRANSHLWVFSPPGGIRRYARRSQPKHSRKR